MKYRVLVPISIKREIGKLPHELMVGVLDKLLTELPSDPNRFLAEVVVPLSVRSYPFIIQDSAGKSHWFVAFIDGIDPASKPELHVVGLRHTEFDPTADTLQIP